MTTQKVSGAGVDMTATARLAEKDVATVDVQKLGSLPRGEFSSLSRNVSALLAELRGQTPAGSGAAATPLPPLPPGQKLA